MIRASVERVYFIEISSVILPGVFDFRIPLRSRGLLVGGKTAVAAALDILVSSTAISVQTGRLDTPGSVY